MTYANKILLLFIFNTPMLNWSKDNQTIITYLFINFELSFVYVCLTFLNQTYQCSWTDKGGDDVGF